MSNKEVINEEKLSKPSTVTPTLFVGLGGCGSDIVMRVKNLLKKDPDFEEKYSELIKFAIVDTNINDLERHRENADDTFLISDFEKSEYSKLASGQLFLEPDEFFTQWIPSDYRFRSGDTAGAGQIRIESRLGCYYQMKHANFNAKFAKLFDSMRGHELGHRRIDTREIRIVICYSVAGGTGSGAHLVMSYMLRDLARMVGKPITIGVAVLPTVFEDKAGVNKDGIFANGYAALKETEHLMKLGSPESKFYPEDGVTFHYNPGDPSKTKVYDKPFDFLYVIDKPQRFTVSNINAAAAAGLYLQFFSAIFKEQAGDYDNYTQHQRFLVPHDFEPKGIPGFTSFYGSYGSTVLHVPGDSLLKYCSNFAAIGILLDNYFSAIPPEEKYDSLRVSDAYFKVYQGKDINNDISVVDFPTDAVARREMMNRLFRKRIHLLANCEYNNKKNNFPNETFGTIFRHGNLVGTIPEEQFGKEQPQDKIIEDGSRAFYDKSGANYSIFQAIVDTLGTGSIDDSTLLQEAIEKGTESFNKAIGALKGKLNENTFNEGATEEDLKTAQKLAIKDGYDFLQVGNYEQGLFGYTLMSNLEKFFKSVAAKTSLNARRYALLQLIEYLQVPEKEKLKEDNTKVEKVNSKGFLGGTRVASIEQQESYIDGIAQGLSVEMTARITNHYIEFLNDFKNVVIEYLNQAADREGSITRFLEEKQELINRWMVKGDDQTEKYVLDGEAFQMENGVRLWDFYYVDQIKGMPELQNGSKEIQDIIASSFQDTQQQGSVANRKLFELLQKKAESIIRTKILGNLEEKDPELKYGLTISKALELEVLYRALYLSKRNELESNPETRLSLIQNAIGVYRSGNQNNINIRDSIHWDYLIDKVKRLLEEKAGYLCFYDKSREGQGGVRADIVKLIAINEDIKNSFLSEIIGRGGAGFKMVTDSWNSRREVVFYQAILNVPLYVFGRLDRMRHFYYQFKNMAKRSKVLHIDKNWENTLLDLDPQEAQQQHRIGLVQSNIIQFSALFSLHRLKGDKATPYILRFDGAYYLRNPNYHDSKVDLTSDDWDFLGNSMSEAIENLPIVLQDRSVRYVEYQQILTAVLKGLTPNILQFVIAYPFQWRQSYDDLRAQYGDTPNPEQQELLKDFKDSYNLLASALSDFLVTLRNQVKEEETLGADSLVDILDSKVVNTKATIQLLEGFERKWDTLLNPKLGDILNSRQDIFAPMDSNAITNLLQSLGKSGQSIPTGKNTSKR